MADLRFIGVSKRYGEIEVIRAMDLEVRDREFMVLVGPSGCGKSTALRMIAGLEEVTGGEIRIGDRVVNDLPPKDRDIAMVFQSYALYPHMTVRQNLDFGLRIRKMPAAERARRVEEAARILGIGELLDRQPRQLSGGQRQRVAVGRAIVRHPAVFLFDEPLSNLDAKLRTQMRAEIAKLQAELATTTVYVTHDQVEAMTMGHRIAVMNAGVVEQVGEPLEVYGRPANLFVANFIGTPPMNLFTVRVTAGGTALAAATFRLPVPPHLAPITAGRDEQPLVLGIRPEHVGEPAGTDGATAPLTVEIEVVETLGHQAIVHGRAGDDRVAATFDPAHAPKIGQRATLALQLAELHLFDAESERRLDA
jgi:multiple sugar transport system ATP-binding protein